MDATLKEIAVTRAVGDLILEPATKNASEEFYQARKNIIVQFKQNGGRNELFGTFGVFMKSEMLRDGVDIDNADQDTYDTYAKQVVNMVAGITPSMLPKFAEEWDSAFTFPLPAEDGLDKTAEVLSWFNDLRAKKLTLAFGVRYFDPNNSDKEVLSKYKVVELKADNLQTHTVAEINQLLTALGLPLITSQEAQDMNIQGDVGEYDLYNALEVGGKFNIPQLYAIGVGIATSKGSF